MGKQVSKQDTLAQHLDFKKTSVHSVEKQKDIARYLNLFFNSSKKPLSDLTEQDLTRFINSCEFSIATMNNIKNYIKVFIKWYYPDYSSRFRNLDKITKQQKPSRTYEPEQMLSIEEVEKLIKAEKDLMYKVYWCVFFYGGFRPSEARRLRWEQVYFEPKGVVIKLHTSKTNKDFYKSLPPNSEHLLREWKRFNDSEWLFPSSQTNRPVSIQSIRAKLRVLSLNVLGKKVVPYQLRHSIATILYKDDKRKDDDTANQLGHSKSMKSVYMNLNEEDLKSKARNIWIKTKPLTEAERTQYQEIIKNLLETIRAVINKDDNKLKEIAEKLEK